MCETLALPGVAQNVPIPQSLIIGQCELVERLYEGGVSLDNIREFALDAKIFFLIAPFEQKWHMAWLRRSK